MLTKIRARVSSAHLMAAVALFLGLGGTALAVQKNSVGSKQLKNNAVKTSKIAANAVDGTKIKDGSVTGTDIDVGSLGKVPAATTADSAGSATTAGSANTAASADDSDQLEGRTLQQVRGLADHNQDTSAQPLDALAPETVMTEDIGVPTGGANIIASASVELVNNAAGQRGAQCVLRDDDGTISSTFNVTLSAGFSAVMSLDGFVTEPLGTGALDPEDISVSCQGSGADDDVAFVNGNLTVQRVPIATGS